MGVGGGRGGAVGGARARACAGGRHLEERLGRRGQHLGGEQVLELGRERRDAAPVAADRVPRVDALETILGLPPAHRLAERGARRGTLELLVGGEGDEPLREVGLLVEHALELAAQQRVREGLPQPAGQAVDVRAVHGVAVPLGDQVV